MAKQAGSSRSTLGFSLAFISAVSYGTMGTFIKFLTDFGFDQMTVAALSVSLVVAFLFIKMLVSSRQNFKADWKGLLMMLFMGVVLLNLTNIGMANAVQTVPIAIISIMMFCNVFIVIVLSRILFKYKITNVKVITTILALFGLSFVLDVYHAGISTIGAGGLMWTLLVMVVTALAYTGNKYILEKGYNWETNLFYQNLFGAVFLWFTLPPWTLAGQVGTVVQSSGGMVWLAVLGFAAIPNILSFITYMKGMELIEPTFVGLMYTLDPVTSSILGMVIFGQMLTGLQIMGVIIVLAAIAWLNIKERQEERAKDQELVLAGKALS